MSESGRRLSKWCPTHHTVRNGTAARINAGTERESGAKHFGQAGYRKRRVWPGGDIRCDVGKPITPLEDGPTIFDDDGRETGNGQLEAEGIKIPIEQTKPEAGSGILGPRARDEQQGGDKCHEGGSEVPHDGRSVVR